MRRYLGWWLIVVGLAGCASPVPAPPAPAPVSTARSGYYRLETVWLGTRPAGAARAAAGFEPVLRWQPGAR